MASDSVVAAAATVRAGVYAIRDKGRKRNEHCWVMCLEPPFPDGHLHCQAGAVVLYDLKQCDKKGERQYAPRSNAWASIPTKDNCSKLWRFSRIGKFSQTHSDEDAHQALLNPPIFAAGKVVVVTMWVTKGKKHCSKPRKLLFDSEGEATTFAVGLKQILAEAAPRLLGEPDAAEEAEIEAGEGDDLDKEEVLPADAIDDANLSTPQPGADRDGDAAETAAASSSTVHTSAVSSRLEMAQRLKQQRQDDDDAMQHAPGAGGDTEAERKKKEAFFASKRAARDEKDATARAEEDATVAAMTPTEREAYEQENADAALHEERKTKALARDLDGYKGAGGGARGKLLKGRGRGRGGGGGQLRPPLGGSGSRVEGDERTLLPDHGNPAEMALYGTDTTSAGGTRPLDGTADPREFPPPASAQIPDDALGDAGRSPPFANEAPPRLVGAANFLTPLGLAQYAAAFDAEGYDTVENLESMGVVELTEDLGMSIVDAQTLLAHLAMSRADAADPPPPFPAAFPSSAEQPEVPPPFPEHLPLFPSGEGNATKESGLPPSSEYGPVSLPPVEEESGKSQPPLPLPNLPPPDTAPPPLQAGSNTGHFPPPEGRANFGTGAVSSRLEMAQRLKQQRQDDAMQHGSHASVQPPKSSLQPQLVGLPPAAPLANARDLKQRLPFGGASSAAPLANGQGKQRPPPPSGEEALEDLRRAEGLPSPPSSSPVDAPPPRGELKKTTTTTTTTKKSGRKNKGKKKGRKKPFKNASDLDTASTWRQKEDAKAKSKEFLEKKAAPKWKQKQDKQKAKDTKARLARQEEASATPAAKADTAAQRNKDSFFASKRSAKKKKKAAAATARAEEEEKVAAMTPVEREAYTQPAAQQERAMAAAAASTPAAAPKEMRASRRVVAVQKAAAQKPAPAAAAALASSSSSSSSVSHKSAITATTAEATTARAQAPGGSTTAAIGIGALWEDDDEAEATTIVARGADASSKEGAPIVVFTAKKSTTAEAEGVATNALTLTWEEGQAIAAAVAEESARRSKLAATSLGWVEVIDAFSGLTCYEETSTGLRSWERPLLLRATSPQISSQTSPFQTPQRSVTESARSPVSSPAELFGQRRRERTLQRELVRRGGTPSSSRVAKTMLQSSSVDYGVGVLATATPMPSQVARTMLDRLENVSPELSARRRRRRARARRLGSSLNVESMGGGTSTKLSRPLSPLARAALSEALAADPHMSFQRALGTYWTGRHDDTYTWFMFFRLLVYILYLLCFA